VQFSPGYSACNRSLITQVKKKMLGMKLDRSEPAFSYFLSYISDPALVLVVSSSTHTHKSSSVIRASITGHVSRLNECT